MKPVRAWVRLQPGRRLDLLEPDPASWTDRDLAIGLSRTYRQSGHSHELITCRGDYDADIL